MANMTLADRFAAVTETKAHTAVLRGAVSDAHLLRRDEAEPEIHRCDRARSQVCQVVHQEVCREPKASSPGVHLLHRPLCGTNGADSGRNHRGISKEPSHDQHAEAKDQGAPKLSVVPEDISSWSEDELDQSWSAADEVSQQGERLNNMENTMSQIANQLQILTQMIHAQQTASQ